jgi:hypothetical protein|tara:strand:+ start:738 stop:1319 length:582 start_codon:yes stop_codon:yes gene_type:complete
MNIALPILLLVFGALTLWILTESSLKWYFKLSCISSFCVFTLIFWSSIHTFLGWGAEEKDVPEKLLIHWVIIKEPNKLLKNKGNIYILAESPRKDSSNKIIDFFSYKNSTLEPRLFKLKYSRPLHEELNKISDKLKKGQPVFGKLTKLEEDGDNGKKGGNKKTNKKGGGSESQDQDWQFHELLPTEIHRKPDR